jgi:hypothetical protein
MLKLILATQMHSEVLLMNTISTIHGTKGIEVPQVSRRRVIMKMMITARVGIPLSTPARPPTGLIVRESFT